MDTEEHNSAQPANQDSGMTTDSGNPQESQPRTNTNSTIAMGLAIGAGLGAALGMVLDNLALGIGIGVAVGVALGASMSNRTADTAATTTGPLRRVILALAVGGLVLLLGVTLVVYLLSRR